METFMVLRWLLHSVTNKFSSSNNKVDDIQSNKFSLSKGSDDHEYYYGDGGANTDHGKQVEQGKCGSNYFQMPLHYPRYKKADYEKMEEWKVDMLLQEYGLSSKGTLEEKRSFAIGAFLWPDQL